ncbi:MAG: YncE family protein, partial [Limisphaerales bacterium]
MAGILYCSFWAVSSCGKKKSTEPKPVNPAIDFNADILPIFQARCNISGCHGGQTASDTAGGLVFSSFDVMRQTVGQKTSWTKPLVISGNPDSSHLVFTIRRLRQSFMPPDTLSPLSSTEINKITDWIKQGAKGPGGKKFPTYREGKLYVANSADGRVDVIDLSMNYKVDSIPTTLAGENPTIVQTHHIAVSPDKKFIYVTNAWAFGHIIKIDAERDSVITRVRAGYQPSDIIVSPDGQYVYTTDYTLGLKIPSVVRKFETQTMALADTFPIGKAPHGIAINKDGTIVLAAGQISDDCWLIYPNVNPLLDSSY